MSILVVETRSARRRVVSIARVCLSRVRDDFHNSIPPLHHLHHLLPIILASVAYELRRISPKKKTIVEPRSERQIFARGGGGGRIAIEIDRIYRDTRSRIEEKREEREKKKVDLQKRRREITGILPGGRRHVVSAGTRLPTLHHEFLVHAGRNQPILKARPVVVPRARGALPSTDYRRSISVSSTQQDLTSSWRVISPGSLATMIYDPDRAVVIGTVGKASRHR